jgi:hypothetical protein
MGSIFLTNPLTKEDYKDLMVGKLSESGYSYATLATELNVSDRVVEKILHGEFESFPSVYIIHLIDQISKKLSVKNPWIKDFILRSKKPGPAGSSATIKSKKGIFVPKIISIFFIGIFTLAGTVFVSQQVLSFVEAPEIEVISPDTTSNDMIQEEFTTIAGITDRKAEVSINGQSLSVGPNGEFSQRVRLTLGLNSFIIVSKNALGRESKESLVVTYNQDKSENQEKDLDISMMDDSADDEAVKP